MSSSSIQADDKGTIHLGGDMNFVSTPGLFRELESKLTDIGSILNIDLTEIDRVDSSGLALLLEWQAMAGNLGHSLHITNAPSSLMRLAKLCEADKLLDISGRELRENDTP
jgi:phospholipid transport system transporter-binding protein